MFSAGSSEVQHAFTPGELFANLGMDDIGSLAPIIL